MNVPAKFFVLTLVVSAGLLTGCAPQVGSDAWCKALKETPKSEWTAQQATDYTRSCIFKSE